MEMARPRRTNGVGITVEDTQICVVMVGLPARGKSLIAQKGVCRRPPPLAPLSSSCPPLPLRTAR
jgi:hypothetical protein